MPRVLAIVLDVASVLVFAAIGRLSHGESLDATQLGRTAAPFLAATLMVWVAMIMKPFLESSSRQGLAVWAVTLVLGMLFEPCWAEASRCRSSSSRASRSAS